jgi:hypothetical protein
MHVVFGWKFVQNLRMKIYPKRFRPEWSFVKSISGHFKPFLASRTQPVIDLFEIRPLLGPRAVIQVSPLNLPKNTRKKLGRLPKFHQNNSLDQKLGT